MGPKRAAENTKKAAGNAKKAEVAAQKQAAEESNKAKADEEDWSKGSKPNFKREAAAEKAAEGARKKAEKEALLAEEEASIPAKPKGAGAKTAVKKMKGLDLSQLESDSSSNIRNAALNATGIDNALDALSLTTSTGAGDKVDRHPERRFKAAYAVYEERRLDEMKDEKGLRRQQKIDTIRKEFEKSEDNPFNQGLVGRFDMSKDEMRELRTEQRDMTESRLAGS